MKRSLLWLFSLTVISGVAACDTENPATYDVDVAWDIGGVPSCKSPELSDELGGVALEFDEIEVTVWKKEADVTDRDAKPVHPPVSVPCKGHEIKINELERGTYYVTVDAYADHQDQRLPYFTGGSELTVPNDETTDVSIRMSTGSVDVSWGFHREMCGSAKVKNVKILLEFDTKEYTSEAVPCDDAEYLFSDLDWGLYSLSIEGFNDDGELTHRGMWIDEDSKDDTDSGEADGGVDEPDDDLLDVRPGRNIDAYVELEEIE